MKRMKQFWFLQAISGSYGNRLFYDMNKKLWVTKEQYSGMDFPATFPCKSYKAALRHLKTHNEITIGTKFKLVSEFIGFDRYLIK